MKGFMRVGILFGFFICLVSCIGNNEAIESPDSVFTKYNAALKSGDYKQAYELLSASDKKEKSFDEFEDKSDFSARWKYIDMNTTLEITGKKILGKKCTLSYNLTSPKYEDLTAALESADMKDKSEMDKYLLLESKYKPIIGMKTSNDLVFNLVKEKNQWRIFENYAEMNRLVKKEEENNQKRIKEYSHFIEFDTKEIFYSDELNLFFVTGLVTNKGEKTVVTLASLFSALDDTGYAIYTYDDRIISEFSEDEEDYLHPKQSKEWTVITKEYALPKNWSQDYRMEITKIRFKE